MALGDVNIISPLGNNLPSARTMRTEANTTVINPGEPVVIGGTNNHYAVACADAKPVVADAAFAGIAASLSNQTASLNGTVDVYPAVPGLVYSCKAKTGSAFDTDAEVLALLNYSVYFDLTSSVYSIDTGNAGNNNTNGLRIVGGDSTTSTVYFTVLPGAVFPS